MEEWIITTAITRGIGVIAYFLKRTMNQVDRQGDRISRVENERIDKADLKEITEELKKDIRQIREDYTPRDAHQKDFDECRKDIKEIRSVYLTKEDFIREMGKLDRKMDQMDQRLDCKLDQMLEIMMKST